MEATVRLYTLNYDEVKTYLWAAIFVVCNLVLPQVFHLIPQGGIIFSPLSLVILVGAYKFGWKTGLLTALASPLVNHLLTGMPAWEVLPVMTMKLAALALVAGLTAQHFKTISLPLLLGVILVTKAIEALGELVMTGGIAATIADFTIGWPGLLLQIVGGYLVIRYLMTR
ncbi:MAG: ECF transporter S component [Prevotella sp.]|nr:ECF transporter S component [Prevotella sp.]